MQYSGADRLPSTYVEGFHDLEAVRKMLYRPLGGRTGLDVSILGFGASSIGGCFRDDTKREECIEVVRHALRSGVNWIDTAAWYGFGKSEEILGEALKGVPRKAFYIATKCCRYKPEVLQMFDWSKERTLQSVDESLKRLGLDYVDVMQVHDPEYAPSPEVIVQQVIPALAQAKAAGKVKMIGMTGYPLSIHKEVVAANKAAGGHPVDTCLSYCHYSMNDSTLVTDWLPWLKEEQLGLINASPISMGLLSDRGPPAWHPAPENVKAACAAAAAHCRKKGVDISRLAMWYSLHSRTDIPTTLVSTASIANLQKNIDSVGYTELGPLEREVLAEIMKEHMEPLNNQTWEGVEVGQWKELAERAKAGEAVGTLSTV
eukprot:TRINITY_DN72354_c0_g1_i1.p1 TRINITY_DN72354_c0_g1~~TRINITY_DN72354_c0_g1_i1.p1  ORF type:complete len:398 (+),score=129.13 TRINITY_DN72354_c0_g1_i1:78-1196(+)